MACRVVTDARRRFWSVLIAGAVLALASCGGSGGDSVSSDKEALNLILASKGERPGSSKGGQSAAVCEGAGPADFGPGSLCADTGFRSSDRFSFANWGKTRYPADELTAAQLFALFGKSVCSSLSDGVCTLSTSGASLLEQLKETYLLGRCEGMVVLASLLKSKVVPLSTFDDAAVDVESLEPDNEELQKSIAYWWLTQYSVAVGEVSGRIREEGMKEVIRQLEVKLSEGTFATMGLYYKGEGHAVLPIGLLRGPDGVFRVPVYDSNLPTEFGVVDIDLANDKWTYARGGINGDEELGVWTGASGTIDLALMTARSETSSCPYCNGNDPTSQTVRVDDYVAPGRDKIDSVFED